MLRGVKLIASLSQPPCSHTSFRICCDGSWPEAVKRDILTWPTAKLSEDEQVVTFSSSAYSEVETRLQQFSRQGAQLELLPAWVRSIVGFSREEEHPLLGLRHQDAERQVRRYVEHLPEEMQRRTPVLSYQMEGVSFGLHRGGRVLIGDEMGLGKSVQALILAAQFTSEWPLLVVVLSLGRFELNGKNCLVFTFMLVWMEFELYRSSIPKSEPG